MKYSWTNDTNRRSFLTGAAATVVGVALGSPFYSRISANDLEGFRDGDATRGDLNIMDSDQPIIKKVCILGASAVGKTSLVRRFVESIYSDEYLKNVGVKIDKKVMDIEGNKMKMLLWDIASVDDYQLLRPSFLKGASGFLLVVDGTRRRTLEVALNLYRGINKEIEPAPSVVVMFNKDDLSSQWEVQNTEIKNLAAKKITAVRVSAKTGKGVENAFLTLATKMLNK